MHFRCADDEGLGDDMPAPAVGSKRPGEKLEQQKEQNRVQARIARQKKKQQVEELKAKVAQLAQEKVQTLRLCVDGTYTKQWHQARLVSFTDCRCAHRCCTGRAREEESCSSAAARLSEVRLAQQAEYCAADACSRCH
jgi:hypothetical protein